ncbi:hypothetical protein [Streptomyces sp. NPDC001205]
MPDVTPNAKGPAPVTVPGAETNPEDVGTLTLTYTDGVPVLTVTDASAIPAQVVILDAEGTPVAIYTASCAPEAVPQARSAVIAPWSTLIDTGASFDASTGIFTVPVTGIYNLESGFSITPN